MARDWRCEEARGMTFGWGVVHLHNLLNGCESRGLAMYLASEEERVILYLDQRYDTQRMAHEPCLFTTYCTIVSIVSAHLLR
jgi:hypothetical protein